MSEKLDIVVRFAKQIEIQDIAKIFKDEFNKKPYEEGWTNKTADVKIKYYFQKSTAKVALINNQIVGFLIYSVEPWFNGEWLRIQELIVSSEFQGMGVGARLMNDIEREAGKRKIKRIILDSYKLSPAYSFYKKFNYQDSGWIGMFKELK